MFITATILTMLKNKFKKIKKRAFRFHQRNSSEKISYGKIGRLIIYRFKRKRLQEKCKLFQEQLIKNFTQKQL